MKDEELRDQVGIEPEQKEEEVEREGLTSEEETVEETVSEEVLQEPKKTPIQKRIDQLTKEKYDARREAEYWKGKANESKPAPPKEETDSGRPQRPSAKGFANDLGEIDYPAYDKAMAKYEDDLEAWRDSNRKAQTESERVRQERENNLSSFNKQAETARKKYADFDEVVNTPIFTPAMQDVIFGSEQGAEIGYYLGKNPDVAMHLGSLSPLQLAREIGKLESRLSAKPMVKKVVTEAPKPINPLGGSETGINKDPDKMTDEEWHVWYKQQKAQKLKLNQEGR